MSVKTLTPPGAEPVSLSEAKAWLRAGHDGEDALISDLIASARMRVEALTGRALITRQLRETLDGWPPRRLSAFGQAFRLAAPPLVSIEAVRIFDADGNAGLWDPAEYRIDTVSEPGRLIAVRPFTLPAPGRLAGAIEIDFTAGYGPDPSGVPAPLREAVLRLIADSYGGSGSADRVRRGEDGLPEGAAHLLRPYRSVRL